MYLMKNVFLRELRKESQIAYRSEVLKDKIKTRLLK